MAELKITTLEELRVVTQGSVVELPPFAEGYPLVARLKRPSMLALVRQGKIPNSLLGTANSLFASGKIDEENPTVLEDLFAIFDAIAEECFLEPTYQQIKETGVELTDEQFMALFNFTQTGVNSLKTFRQQPQDT